MVTSGALVSSLTINSTFLPATVSPFCAMYRRAAASICLPVEANGPVIGRIRPILNLLSWALASVASIEPHRAMKKCLIMKVSGWGMSAHRVTHQRVLDDGQSLGQVQAEVAQHRQRPMGRREELLQAVGD